METWHAPPRYMGHYWDRGQHYAVMAEATIAPIGRLAQTVTHGTSPADAPRLAIIGELRIARRDGMPDRRYREPVAYGQIAHQVPWHRMRADTRKLGDIWQVWHLNDMCALCAHQTGPWEQAAPCPLTGYRAGTAHLVDPLPDGIIAEVRRIFGDPLP